MILFPAIDLKDGACVRLVRGEMASATVFNDDPAAQARQFADAGFTWLHVVDLNGAFAGHPVNGEAVTAIRAAVGLRIQLGGGIRDRAAIEALARRSASTGSCSAPRRCATRSWCGAPPPITRARSSSASMRAKAGWRSRAGPRRREIGAVELARRFADCGVAAIVYTDIARDGALGGIDAGSIAELGARRSRFPIIASGGVASLADIAALKAHEADGIAGIICGRALYDGRIDPRRRCGS